MVTFNVIISDDAWEVNDLGNSFCLRVSFPTIIVGNYILDLPRLIK